MLNDIEVIRRVKSGEIEAFLHLVEKYHRRLLIFIHRLVNDKCIVEDIGQDVFLNVYKSLDNFDEKAGVPFSAWLFIAARNRALSELRKQRGIKKTGLDESIDPVDQRLTGIELLIDKEQRKVIEDCLEQLPKIYRNVIIKSLQGDSIKEIAQFEDITTGTVKSRLFRARGKLKFLVREYLGVKIMSEFEFSDNFVEKVMEDVRSYERTREVASSFSSGLLAHTRLAGLCLQRVCCWEP